MLARRKYHSHQNFLSVSLITLTQTRLTIPACFALLRRCRMRRSETRNERIRSHLCYLLSALVPWSTQLAGSLDPSALLSSTACSVNFGARQFAVPRQLATFMVSCPICGHGNDTLTGALPRATFARCALTKALEATSKLLAAGAGE